MASIGTINPGTGKVVKNQQEVDKFKAQQARLNADSAKNAALTSQPVKVAPPVTTQNAVKGVFRNKTTGAYTDAYGKPVDAMGNRIKAPVVQVNPYNPKKEARGLVDNEFQSTIDTADEFGLVTKGMPTNLAEWTAQQAAELKREADFQRGQLNMQSGLDAKALARTTEQGESAIAGQKAIMAQGREGVMGSSKPLVADKFATATRQVIDEAATRVKMAEAERENARAQLAKAEMDGNTELATAIQGKLAKAEQDIRIAQADKMNAENEAARIVIAENDSKAAIAQSNLNTFQGLIATGEELTPQAIKTFSSQLGLDFETAFDYYEGAKMIREDKRLTNEEKAVNIQSLNQDLQDKLRGITTEKARNLDLYMNLRKSGQYNQDEMFDFARALGVDLADDPFVQAELKIKQNEALIQQIMAGYVGVREQLEINKLQTENQIQQFELNDMMGVGGDTFGDFDTYTSSLGTLTQNFDTPVNYMKGRNIHGGYDIAGKAGSNIPAFVAGTVVETGKGNKGWGNYVVIEDAQGNTHRYAHLQDIGANKGDIITAGGSVGTMGKSGNVFGETGVHLHYEVKDAKGNLIDPKSLVGSGGGKAQEIAETIFNGGSALTLKDLPVKERSKVDMELNKLKEQAMASGDAVGAMRASAGGDKPSDAFRTQIGKTAATINQLGALSTALNKRKINDPSGNEVDISPITGWLKKKNPWSQEGQELNAMMQATIPNLARGVYGEVGVLTDQDVELYRKTLPNLTQPEEIRKSVTAITLRSVRNSLRDSLVLAAGSGTDVSGLVNYYQELDNKVKQMESDLGVVEDNTPDVANNPWATIDTTPDITVGEEDYTPDDIASLFDSVIKKR